MDTPQYCMTTIKANYNQFSKAEKIIADYILQSPSKILHQTISQVADELNVATSTVFKFCKTLGFKGYQAMKIALATEVASPAMEMIEEKINEFDTEQQITEKIFNTNIRTFQDTMKMMDFGMLRRAVEAIVKANYIEFYGLGRSAIVATDAHHKFVGSGISSSAYTDSYLQMKAAAQLTVKDTAIFISDSQTSDEFLKVVDVAKATGATTIGMTYSNRSELGKLVDIVLITATNYQDTLTNGDSQSMVIQMSLIDALYVNVINAKEGFLKNSINKLKSYIRK